MERHWNEQNSDSVCVGKAKKSHMQWKLPIELSKSNPFFCAEGCENWHLETRKKFACTLLWYIKNKWYSRAYIGFSCCGRIFSMHKAVYCYSTVPVKLRSTQKNNIAYLFSYISFSNRHLLLPSGLSGYSMINNGTT